MITWPGLLPTARCRSLGRALAAALLALLLSNCAHVDRKRFDSLEQAATALRDRVAATHVRVKRLQEAVFRAKVSLSPKLEEDTLDKPDWLDTGAQFRSREAVLDEVAEFIEGLHEVAERQGDEQIRRSALKLFGGSDTALQTAKDLLATLPALQPNAPGLGDMVSRLFPTAALVGGMLAEPVQERARRGDMLALMQSAAPLIRDKLRTLLPGNQVMAEYTLALKTEYVGDATLLRDGFSGAERYRFDQIMLDLLQEFDATSADAAALTKLMELLISAYEEAAAELKQPQSGGSSLHELLLQLRKAQAQRGEAP